MIRFARAEYPRRDCEATRSYALQRPMLTVQLLKMPKARRLRGALLRLALSRPMALTSGLVLLVPAIVIAVADYPWENWLSDGLGLIGAGTGAALVFTALQGRRPDWIDPN